MKKLFYIFTLCILIPTLNSAQHLEIGGSGGFSSYMGDLSPSNGKLSTGEQRYAIGGFIRYHKNDFLTAKLGMHLGRLSARDYDSQNDGRKARNLAFKTVLFETAFTIEYNILGYEPKFLTRTFSPYVFAGVGVFTFNPKTIYQGKWVELQPLNTEGQGLAEYPDRKPYKKVAFALPFGVGFKYAISDRINIGMEMGMRKTNTDYIDDVSTTYAGDDIQNENYGEVSAALANRSGTPKVAGAQRGNSAVKDYYLINTMTISYNFIDSGLAGSRLKRRRPMGCPTF